MISKKIAVILISLFSQLSWANFQALKSGFIYVRPDFNRCGALIKTYEREKVLSIEEVSNPVSGLYCPGLGQGSYKCENSRCISLHHIDSRNEKLFTYLIIAESGDFYLNNINCSLDKDGMPVDCKNPGTPVFMSATKHSTVKPFLFKGESSYIDNYKDAPAQSLKGAIEKARIAAEFDCAKFWRSCTHEHSLDIVSDYGGGGFVTVFVKGK